MSKINVDTWEPESGTAATLMASGDTVTVPSGATLAVASGATLAVAGSFNSVGIDDNASSTAMTINASGQIGAGVSPSFNFHVESSANSGYVSEIENTSTTTPSVLQLRFGGSAPDDNTSKFLSCGDTAATRLMIYSDGDVVNADNSYGGISDESLKRDITDSGSQWDDIAQLRIRKFSFKSDPNAEQKIGVVAQEVEQVSPHLVYEDDGIKGVKYSILYLKAVKALQEAMERIEVLEGRVNEIEVAE